MTPARPLTHLGRWVVAALSLAACAALVTTAWRGRQTSLELAGLVEQGMAESFMSSLRRASRGPPSDDSVLRAVLARESDAGLRAIAAVDGDGRVVMSAGRLDPTPLSVGTPGVIHLGGGRVRYLPPLVGRPMLMPGLPGFDGRPPGPMLDGPPDFDGPPGPGGPPGFPGSPPGPPSRPVIEFEPLAARAAIRESERTLAIALASSVLLLAAAAWFWRRSVRGESIEQRTLHQDRLAELGKMTALIAHEIRNPLASMKGHAQLLAEALPEGTPDRVQADRVVTASTRIERLVRDLLDFVREGVAVRTSCDPAALARDVAEEVGLPLRVRAEPDVGTLSLDARRLRLAVANLMQNAAQASATELELTLSLRAGALSLELRDNGVGLAPEDLEAIFEPFVTRRTRGIGLGLAVVRRVAELHGGGVSARNHPDGGAVFTMVLPTSPARSGRRDTARALRHAPDRGADPGGG